MCTWGRPRADADRDAAWKHKKTSKTSVWTVFRSWLSRTMDDGDDVEDHLGPPDKIARLPGRQTRSSFGRTEANLCLFCQTKKRDRRDRRRFENLVRCEGDSTPATLVSAADVRPETRGFFWKFDTRICGPKMCYTIDRATSPTRRHPL